MIRWPHLDSNEPGKHQNAGNTGNTGNTPRTIGVSCVSSVGKTLETPETKPYRQAQAVSAVSAMETTPETQNRRENGSVSAVSNVSAKKSITERKRLPTPEDMLRWSEFLIERAAVKQHDGELPAAEADRRAWAELLSRYPGAAAIFAPGGGHA